MAVQATVDVGGSQRCFRINNEALDRSLNFARINTIVSKTKIEVEETHSNHACRSRFIRRDNRMMSSR